MSNICNLLRLLTRVVERDGHQWLHYCTASSTTYATEPAPYLELVFLDKGSVPELRMGPAVHAFPPGHLALHNVHFGSKAPATCRFRARCVFFDLRASREFDFLADQPLFHSVKLSRPEPLQAAINRLVTRSRLSSWQPPEYPAPPEFLAMRRQRRLSPSDALYLKSALLEIMAVALEAWTDAEPGGRGNVPAAVERALDWIHLHYTEPDLGLRAIARAACLDPSHFGRVFHQAMGETPMRYLRSVRVAHAATLLRQTDLSVGAVGVAAGVPNQFLFSRMFKLESGVSPMGYRRPYKGNT